MKAAVWILLAPAAAITQDSPDFFVPDLDSDVLLMAELVEATVTFVEPTGIGAVNDLQFSNPAAESGEVKTSHLESDAA